MLALYADHANFNGCSEVTGRSMPILEYRAGGRTICSGCAMIYGLYLSAQGAQIQTLRQAVVSNNIANAATTSFKRDLVTAQAHLPYDAEHGKPTWIQGNLYDMPGGVTPGNSVTDY